MKSLAITLTILSACGFSSQQETQTNRSDEVFANCFGSMEINNTDDGNPVRLFKHQQQFALSLLRNIYRSTVAGTNIFFSPSSIFQSLLLSYFISLNQTEYTVKRALTLPENMLKSKVFESYKVESELHKLRLSNGTYDFTTANKLFVAQSLKLKTCASQVFNEELEALNFGNEAGASLKRINDWVASQTKNQIEDLLSNGDVTEETKLVLANAAYYKGSWHSKFPATNTRKEVFYITGSKNTLVTMMRQKGNFKYLVSDRLGAHVIQLPYVGEEISMFILLPPFVSPNGIASLLENLNEEALTELLEPGYLVERPVEVSLPKFTIEQEVELVPILETLGVGDLFRSTANLTALTENENISFNDAKHKAKVSVDEEGTVAAGATAFFSFRSSRPLEPIKFICNHPFLFFLYDGVSQTILFTGVYNTPPIDE